MPPPSHVRFEARPDGTTVMVPIDASTPEGAAEIEDAVRVGSRSVATLDDNLRAELARGQQVERYRAAIRDTPGAAFATGARGVADALTLGLMGLAESEDDRLLLEAARMENGGSYSAGYGLGAILPALITGGASLGESGAMALTPGGFTAALGNTVTNQVSRRLAAAGFGQGLTRAGSVAIGAAADGMVGGALDTIAQSNIQGTPLEGEQLLSNSLFGAALGLGLGTVFGGLQGGLVALQGRRANAVFNQLQEGGMAQRVPQEAMLGLDPSSPTFWRDVSERAATLPPENRAQWVRLMGSGLPNQNLRDALGRVVASGSRAFDDAGWLAAVSHQSNRLEEVASQARRATEVFEDGVQRQQLLRRMASVDPEVFSGARQALSMATDAVNTTRTMGGLGNAAAWADRVEGALRSAERAGNSGDFVARLDDALEGIIAQAPQGNVAAQNLATQVAARVEAAASAVAPGFGPIRQTMRAHRAASADAGAFMRTMASGETRFNAEQLSQALGHSAFQVRRQRLPELMQWLEQTDELYNRLEDIGVNVDAQRANLRSVAVDIPQLADWGHIIGDVRALRSVESQGAGIQAAIGRGAIGAVAGALMGGGKGAAIGGALGTALAVVGHPLGAVQFMATMQTNLGRNSARFAQGVQKVRRSLLEPRLVRATQTARALSVNVRQLRNPESRRKEYEEITEQLRQYAANPESLLSQTELMTSQASQVAPAVGDAMAQSMVQGVMYLANHLPPASQPSLFPQSRRPPSDAEMIDFLRRYEAIEDPLSLLDRTADGSITDAHVDAVRAVYPRMYQQIQGEIANIISELDDASLIPYARRTRIGILMGVPADPTLDPRFLFRMQQTYSQTPEQNRVQGGRVSLSQQFSSATQSRSTSLTYNL